MREFRFSNAEWREYQQMPDQGYSHRGYLEFVVNRWLAEHDREIEAQGRKAERERIISLLNNNHTYNGDCVGCEAIALIKGADK